MANMFRTVLATVLLASTQAGRIQVHEAQSQAKFGPSCDVLQSRFHDRVTAIQASLEGLDEQSELSATARTHLSMRMFGIIRILRRSRECSWVIENNSEDLEHMRGVIQRLLAGNPCADAARSEFERGSSDENPESISRAMSILLSDDCEAPETPESANTDATTEEQLQETEDELQDHFDDLDTDGSAFIEVGKSQILSGFMRYIGVFFFMLFLILACAAFTVAIMAFLAAALTLLVGITFLTINGAGSQAAIALATITGGVGFPSCAIQLYNNLVLQGPIGN